MLYANIMPLKINLKVANIANIFNAALYSYISFLFMHPF